MPGIFTCRGFRLPLSVTRSTDVYALWVAPAVRHLRGGELLVNAATQWLAERRVHDVFAWIADGNRNAMRFYERLGFGPTGERRRIPAHPEEFETLLVRRVTDQ